METFIIIVVSILILLITSQITYNTLLKARSKYGSLHEVQQCLAIYQDMRKAGYVSFTRITDNLNNLSFPSYVYPCTPCLFHFKSHVHNFCNIFGCLWDHYLMVSNFKYNSELPMPSKVCMLFQALYALKCIRKVVYCWCYIHNVNFGMADPIQYCFFSIRPRYDFISCCCFGYNFSHSELVVKVCFWEVEIPNQLYMHRQIRAYKGSGNPHLMSYLLGLH